MMRIVFLDSSTLGDASLQSISQLGELVCYPTSTPQEALERVGDAEVIITNKVKITPELLDAAPKLKLVCEAATGIDNIDTKATQSRGIEVKNVRSYSTDSVAQLAFTQILALCSKSRKYDTFVKDGSYARSPIFTEVSEPFTELAGKTLGIIGLGAIGSKVAKIAEAFGMKVAYCSTSGVPHSDLYPCLSLQELLSTSDLVTLHCPLNDRTRGLIGKSELAMMKPSAILVNMARGGIVDEAALSDAVSNGTISGAAVDTFSREPVLAENPLLHCTRPDRLRLTPHVAWASKEAIDRLVEGIAANIKTFYNN